MSETNDELWDQVTADAGAFSELTTETGTELSDLIRAVNTVEVDILTREEELKKLKKAREKYIFDLIPSKMNQIGMSKVEVDGNTVSLSTFVNATMPKDPSEKLKALNHLRDLWFSDFIKNEVHVVFGIHEDSRAQALQTDLDAKGHETTSRVWVEPQTLKKVIREDMENGHKLNGEIFNTYIGTVAKIKGTR